MVVTHCQNTACGKKLDLRLTRDSGRKKYCNIVCAGAAKRRPAKYQISEETRHRLDEVKHLIGTDIPERIADRTGYTSVDSMLRALARGREYGTVKKVIAEHRRYLGDDDDQG